VASMLRHHWAERYTLRLADLRPVEDLASHEEFVALDIADLDAFTAACVDMDTVVHLAADPSPAADFYDSLLQCNLIGGYNGFEAARRAACRRLVFASSINAVLGYGGTETPTAWDAPIYPQNVYGASKCWGEALARVYADQHGLSCLCVRLTSPSFDPAADHDPQQSVCTISARDTAQVFGRCVEAAEDLAFGIVHGVSHHQVGWLRVSESDPRIGYEPQDGTAL
jgi:nucleoside-diphosphate-sugar epimerase